MFQLGDWDDLIHGTLVFGATLPFALALGVGLRLSGRLWIAVGIALAGPLLWFFGIPTPSSGGDDSLRPPLSSDDALVSALAVALALVGFAALPPRWRAARHPARVLLWALLAWFLYPAWLAGEGGSPRRFLVTGSMAFTISGFGWAMERLVRDAPLARFGLTPTSMIPLAAGLSIILATGGASQFAQSCGALAASMAALCVVLLLREKTGGLPQAAAVWGMLLVFLAWSGWLFAEIRPGAAALLFLSPFAALAARMLPLPRHRPVLAMFWDGVAATLAAAPVIAAVVLEYTASGAGDYEGY